jgi:hypothetical protein
MRTYIEAVVPHTPGLQGGSRHRELFGGLTLGDTLRSQFPVLLKEVCAFESIPAWLATMVDWWHVLDDGSHSDLLCQSLACSSSWLRMARSLPRFNLYWG